MSKLDKTQVLEAFEQAYLAKHGKAPEITAKSGWYSIDGGKNIRLADVQELTESLTGNSVAAPKVKVTASTQTTNASKSIDYIVLSRDEENGFTAEELWIKVLAEREHDCRLPRGVV